MEKLKQAIKYGAESKIIKPKIARACDVDIRSPAWPNLFSIKEKESLRKINGVGFKNEKLALYPIEPDTTINGTDFGQLYHKGLLFINGEKDNLENLMQSGVFGSPEKNMITYLMKCSANIKTFDTVRGYGRVRLWVDKKELMKRRSIFIDPETIHDNYFHEKPGDAYFIFGGIPRESIVDFSFDDY